MTKQIFINLAVKDLQKSMDFYTALGFTNNPQFSDESGKSANHLLPKSRSILNFVLAVKLFS